MLYQILVFVWLVKPRNLDAFPVRRRNTTRFPSQPTLRKKYHNKGNSMKMKIFGITIQLLITTTFLCTIAHPSYAQHVTMRPWIHKTNSLRQHKTRKCKIINTNQRLLCAPHKRKLKLWTTLTAICIATATRRHHHGTHSQTMSCAHEKLVHQPKTLIKTKPPLPTPMEKWEKHNFRLMSKLLIKPVQPQ